MAQHEHTMVDTACSQERGRVPVTLTFHYADLAGQSVSTGFIYTAPCNIDMSLEEHNVHLNEIETFPGYFFTCSFKTSSCVGAVACIQLALCPQ